jgi:hypothetical protein
MVAKSRGEPYRRIPTLQGRPRKLFVLFLIGLVSSAQAQRPGYPPDILDARIDVYRSVGDVELKAWIVERRGTVSRTRNQRSYSSAMLAWQGEPGTVVQSG